MFLELSFDSRAGDKEVSESKTATGWRYDHEDKEEMSLDELILDFQQSATNRRSRLNQSALGSDVSLLRIASPPKHSKATKSDKKHRNFGDHARAAKQQPATRRSVRTCCAKTVQHEDFSDSEGAVSPMPRLENVLKNKPSLIPKRRTLVHAAVASTRVKPPPIQQRKLETRSPVLSSPSLSPPSLSPVTSLSAASSPLSVSEYIYESVSPDEDSIDALIGKDIRDLNKLILSGSQRNNHSREKTVNAARSTTTNEMSSVIRQSTRFRKAESKDLRSSLRFQVPRGKSKSMKPESPPPPPAPEDSEDDEEDSFAEEIRKLRESRRVSSISATVPELEVRKEENNSDNTNICATAALKVRNASNAINELLLEALKPFEDRQREEEKANTLEEEISGENAAIRNAATSELQSATQTIVSQLDLTFADMTDRRKADMKADADAIAAAKEAEKKEKEVAEEKKKVEEKKVKEREMEILRLIPMQGKLLTCSTDIENVLVQLDIADTIAPSESEDGAAAMETEIKALRNKMQHKIQQIEARMSASPKKSQSDQNDEVSWRTVDWARDTFEIDHITPSERIESQDFEVSENVGTEVAPTECDGAFEEVLQRQVLEKLDLTMLKLKHILALDTKEVAEAKEKQQQEKLEQEKKQAQKQLEIDLKQRELEDAENARRRVMGLTSVDEVEGWVEEGRQLQDVFGYDRSLKRLMNAQNESKDSTYLGNALFNKEEAQRQFDRLTSAMAAQDQVKNSDEEEIIKRKVYKQSRGHESRPALRQQEVVQMQTIVKPRWIEIASCSSDSEGDANGSDSDDPPSVWIEHHRSKQRADADEYYRNRAPQHSSAPSPPRQPRGKVSSSHEPPEIHHHDEKYPDSGKQHAVRFSAGSKQRRRKRGASRHQQEVTRTIQALQAERRQKTKWIRSRICNPSTGQRPVY